MAALPCPAPRTGPALCLTSAAAFAGTAHGMLFAKLFFYIPILFCCPFPHQFTAAPRLSFWDVLIAITWEQRGREGCSSPLRAH